MDIAADSNQKESFIPFALPCIGEEEIEAVVSTMRSGWLTTGPKTQEFEQAFGKAVGAKHALADRKSTRLNSSHSQQSRMPSSA